MKKRAKKKTKKGKTVSLSLKRQQRILRSFSLFKKEYILEKYKDHDASFAEYVYIDQLESDLRINKNIPKKQWLPYVIYAYDLLQTRSVDLMRKKMLVSFICVELSCIKKFSPKFPKQISYQWLLRNLNSSIPSKIFYTNSFAPFLKYGEYKESVTINDDFYRQVKGSNRFHFSYHIVKEEGWDEWNRWIYMFPKDIFALNEKGEIVLKPEAQIVTDKARADKK